MGLKEKSSIVSVILSVFIAAIAIAQVTYVILTGNTNIRIFLIASAIGSFAVLAVVAMHVIQSDKAVGETRKDLATPKAKDCPEYWTRTWSPCKKSYSCSSKYTLPDGTEMLMTPVEANIDLTDYNMSAVNNCATVQGGDANYPYMEMINRCRAHARS